MGSEMCIRDRLYQLSYPGAPPKRPSNLKSPPALFCRGSSQADQSSHVVASSFKGLTGSQSSGPGREDVVHEPDRAVPLVCPWGRPGTPRSGWFGVGVCSDGVGSTRHGCGAAALPSAGPIPGQCAAVGGWIVAASSLESAPALLLRAGCSAQTAAEPRPQALCLDAVDAASASAGANSLRKPREHTTARAASP